MPRSANVVCGCLSFGRYGEPGSGQAAAAPAANAALPGGAGGLGQIDLMSASSLVAGAEAFLLSAPEDHTGAKSDLNQYWYSAPSIRQLVR